MTEPEWDENYDEEEELGSAELADREYNDTPDIVSQKSAAKVMRAVNEDGTLRRIVRARRSDFVHNLIYLDGGKFSFAGRDYLRPIYDRDDKQILLKNARQTEKTTFLANNLTVTSVVQPYNKSLYVSPSHMQTRQFSNEKLRPAIDKSPLIKRYFQDSSVSYQVFEKGFTNGSYIFLRSAFRSADRTRGISAKILCTYGDTRIFVEGIGQVKIEDVYQELVGKKILTWNESTGAVEYDVVRKAIKTCTGRRRLLSIRSKTGRVVTVTGDHPVLTWNGWRRADELALGDYVLEGRIPFAESSDFTEDETFFLGCLLGDGCHHDADHVSFGTTDDALYEKMISVSDRLGLKYSVNDRYRYSELACRRIHEKRIFYYNYVNQECENLLERAGILGQGIEDKSIPFLNRLDHTCGRVLLEALLATDGCIHSSFNPENKKSPLAVSLSYTSVSESLSSDFVTLMRMLGASSVKLYKSHPKNGISKRVQYRSSCRTYESLSAILSVLKCVPGKEAALSKARALLNTYALGKTKDDMVPVLGRDVRKRLQERFRTGMVSLRQYQQAHGFMLVDNCRLSRDVAKVVLDTLEDHDMGIKVSPGLFWSPVAEIAEVPSRRRTPVYDITMARNFNFLANNLVIHNCLDELQDFVTSEIPVIMECTSHFPDARIIMSGTPKSHDNPIEIYWASTTQNEWVVKCQHCGKNNFLDETNVAPTDFYTSGKLPPGPVCKGCQKPIYPSQDGRWVSFRPGAPIQGYRIPQLMVPWICGLYEQWIKLLWKRDNYPLGQFYNEVLGLSYDSASKPITRDEIIECCADYSLWNPANLNAIMQEARKFQLTAGVDWGEGNDGSERSPTGKIRTASYTVLTIGAYINQRVWKTFMVKKYMGKEIDPDYIVKDIARISNALDIKLVGVDWGHGWGVNNHLVRLLGPRRVVQYQHLPKLKQKMKWDHIGFRYHLHRNFMMSELFFDMKNHFVQFPKWAEFEPFAKDILGIYAEYVEYKREIKFDHRPSDPDDFFHSLLYAKLTSDVFHGKSKRFTFDIEGGIGSAGLSYT